MSEEATDEVVYTYTLFKSGTRDRIGQVRIKSGDHLYGELIESPNPPKKITAGETQAILT